MPDELFAENQRHLSLGLRLLHNDMDLFSSKLSGLETTIGRILQTATREGR